MADRTKSLMWRWSLVGMTITALFWTIWYLIAAHVPSVSTVALLHNDAWTLELPFAISRWWDIAIAPFFIVPLVLLTAYKGKYKKAVGTGLVFGLVYGLVFCIKFLFSSKTQRWLLAKDKE